ncbi:MAG: DUF262 domain-containing protein [Sphingobacteriaceae bacterium]|nr:MAG: DUF262 domain-containing protein [Sphingobacteriaceae bacterium]
MKISVKNFKIKDIIALKSEINLTPIYQRGSVWSAKKRKLLIDSILMGIDIPKIYFRNISDALYKFEISDGQQRLRAILDFIDDKYKLDRCVVNNIDFSGKKYSEFSSDEKDIISNYELTISTIEEATSLEVRTLFSRLQMGEHLIPSELRNALASNVSYAINMLATTNPFFASCKIPSSRFKHQDYIAHAIALIHFHNKSDLKASLLLKLYQELAVSYPNEHFKNSAAVLKVMEEVNTKAKFKIINKWAFVDTFYFIYRHIENINQLDTTCYADSFLEFEKRRLQHGNSPEKLLLGEKVSEADRSLYNYIQAFKTSGGHPKNIQSRQDVFDFLFTPCITVKS